MDLGDFIDSIFVVIVVTTLIITIPKLEKRLEKLETLHNNYICLECYSLIQK